MPFSISTYRALFPLQQHLSPSNAARVFPDSGSPMRNHAGAFSVTAPHSAGPSTDQSRGWCAEKSNRRSKKSQGLDDAGPKSDPAASVNSVGIGQLSSAGEDVSKRGCPVGSVPSEHRKGLPRDGPRARRHL